MAILIRNAARDQDFQEGSMENYELILKENMKKLHSTNMTPEEKLQESYKAQDREIKKQLMERKKSHIIKITKHLKINDSLSAFLSISGVILAFVEAELNYSYVQSLGYAGSNTTCYILRSLVLLFTIILVYTIIKHHYYKYKIKREKMASSEGIGESFIVSPNFR